jgi:hypothetical protein
MFLWNYRVRPIGNKITVSIAEGNFAASLDPMADLAYKPSGDTYFDAPFDKATSPLVVINIREIDAIFERHISCFVILSLKASLLTRDPCRRCVLSRAHQRVHEQ